MKKFLFLLSLVIFTLGASMNTQAQNSTTFDKQLMFNESFLPVVGGTTDVIGVAGDSTWQYTVKRLIPDKQLPYVYLKLNRVNTTGTVTVGIWGKQTLNSVYDTIGSVVVWKKTTADTLITFAPASYGIYDYVQLKIKGSSAVAGGKVTYIDFKFVEE